jgi:hypothetical protein
VKLYDQICPSNFCVVFTHHVLTICEIISSNLWWQIFVFILIHHVLTLHEIIQSNLSWQFFVFMLIHHVLILCEIIQWNLSCEFLCKFVCCLIIMLHSTICVFVLSYHFARQFEFCIVLSSCNNQFVLVVLSNIHFVRQFCVLLNMMWAKLNSNACWEDKKKFNFHMRWLRCDVWKNKYERILVGNYFLQLLSK